MENLDRRYALKVIAAAGAGIAFAGTAMAQDATLAPPAFRGQHQPKPLPFDPAKLNGISEKLIRSHWENNYQGAVRALNVVETRLDAMLKDNDLPPYVYGDLKREELLRTGSLVLHEYYFANLGGDGKPGGEVAKALGSAFGSMERWNAEMKRTANALSGGSGWVILGFNLHTGELHNYWSWDHMHNAPAALPLLVLDMYEHAYQMDYGAKAGDYVNAFMKIVSWKNANEVFAKASRA